MFFYSSNKSIDLSINNFAFPIRKSPNVNLHPDELKFNEQISGYRSRIETFFDTFSQTFERFHKIKNIRITTDKTYNIQLKLACFFSNVKIFCELGKIIPNNVHIRW